MTVEPQRNVIFRVRKMGEGSMVEFLRQVAPMFQNPSPVALVFSPSWAGFGRLENNGNLVLAPKARCAVDEVFEVRLFDGAGEARWVCHGDLSGRGRGVFLDESPVEECRENEFTATVEVIQETYVLWGSVVSEEEEKRADWRRLFEHRTGEIYVPISPERSSGNFVVLDTALYFGIGAPSKERHGNFQIIGERLVRLRQAGEAELLVAG